MKASIHNPSSNSDYTPMKRDWSPYADNGGTSITICGPGYAVVASDTRLSSGYLILSRKETCCFRLNEKVFVSLTGCRCDALTFIRNLQAMHKMYQYEHGRPMDIRAAAQFVSIQLYNKRFFPYYVGACVAGLDDQGNGVCFGYDPVGCIEELQFNVAGSSEAILAPLVDHQMGQKNVKAELKRTQPLSLPEAVALVKDCFISACERDIHCGDSVNLNIITPQGTTTESLALRRD